jgi:hypothetical protein
MALVQTLSQDNNGRRLAAERHDGICRSILINGGEVKEKSRRSQDVRCPCLVYILRGPITSSATRYSTRFFLFASRLHNRMCPQLFEQTTTHIMMFRESISSVSAEAQTMRRFGRREHKEEPIELLPHISSSSPFSSPSPSPSPSRSHPTNNLSAAPQSSTPTNTTTKLSKPPSLSPSNPVSHLLRLPLELRISIFRYLIPKPNRSSFNIYPSRDVSSSCQLYTRYYIRQCSLCDHAQSLQRYWNHPHPHPCPLYECQRHPSQGTNNVPNSLAILRTSHQLHEEALSILYGENKFNFLSLSPNFLPVLDWVRKLSPVAKRQMRQIRVSLMPSVREEQIGAFEELMLEWLPGLVVLDSIGGRVREEPRNS